MKNYTELLKIARAMCSARHTALAAKPEAPPDDRELKLLNLLVRTAMQLVEVVEIPKLGAPVPVPKELEIPSGKEWKNIDNSKPCPDGFKMTDKHPATYAQFVAHGWSDEQLVEHGYMTQVEAPDGEVKS